MTWPAAAVFRLLVAALCGAVIGWEREVHEKGAGLRTHILMCVGACLFALIALSMHRDFPGGDVLRLLQGMLLGVSFLAGGVIFTRGGSIHGLTTAAGLWVLTGIGLAVGLGYYFLAACTTLLAAATIAWLKRLERHLHRGPESPDEMPGSRPGD